MLPAVVETIAETRIAISAARSSGKRVALVPTMGALHAGHASLIRSARADCEFNVVSIFVNPTQFGPNEDYARYPRTFQADRELCGAVGADLIFAPSAGEMYPADSRTIVEVASLQDVLCGRSRPGHFRGVATIVLKLLEIVRPDVAVFGQKDGQQSLIIQRMVADLKVPVRIQIHPTIRESDGLAMSSRNRYLDPTQRMHATCLYRALGTVEKMVKAGTYSIPDLQSAMVELINRTPGAQLDYAEIRDAATLEELSTLDRTALAAIAVYFGSTRLIDNTLLNP